MRNLIPNFISDQFKASKFRGNFNAIAMFVDISGFTSLTETLMKHDKEGAEVLTQVLNNIFNPIVRKVYANGGMISTFAGDAFTTIFPTDSPTTNAHLYATQSAFYINQFFNEHKIVSTKYGNFEMGVKVGLSTGQVDWGILGNKAEVTSGKNAMFTYFFRGEAIDNCSKSEHHAEKGDIIADEKMLSLIKDKVNYTELPETNYFKLTSCSINESDTPPLTKTTSKEFTKDDLNPFVLNGVMDLTTEGEFREICVLFISFDEPKNNIILNRFTQSAIELALNYGGYFNKIDFGDKGGTMLLLFGAPVSFENNLERACNFIFDFKSKSLGVKWRAGLTYGTVYVGIIGGKERCEYTSIGDVVNLSARFMMKADWNEIWTNDSIYKRLESTHKFKSLGAFKFKGKSEEISVYQLLGKKDISELEAYTDEIVGRDEELKRLKEYINPIFDKKFAGITYIYGEAGIGKSRLVYEFKKRITNSKSQITNLDSSIVIRHSSILSGSIVLQMKH